MEPAHAGSPIPESLAPFFPEYRLADLDLSRDAATVIERTLRYGNRQELRWLFRSYPRSAIGDWVRRSASCWLPPAQGAFWRQVLQTEGE